MPGSGRRVPLEQNNRRCPLSLFFDSFQGFLLCLFPLHSLSPSSLLLHPHSLLIQVVCPARSFVRSFARSIVRHSVRWSQLPRSSPFPSYSTIRAVHHNVWFSLLFGPRSSGSLADQPSTTIFTLFPRFVGQICLLPSFHVRSLARSRLRLYAPLYLDATCLTLPCLTLRAFPTLLALTYVPSLHYHTTVLVTYPSFLPKPTFPT
ncbi:hypothetical protein BU24DRAFT_164169 [Aaosphaeria arxii CBS 175.79]|uniref:Uncharacterized protein n=1 Tax=Aaosphaeria arxii CBS 175.79 TaxID=1450172 RepID=A0A6A5XYM2_9PLEO|nr:uncharacterized protein BU24DRAFT_164169 [Aaosphaeria arxii CBS 175.79]KAF2018059.1 hypothetical protein BU24DRAFT_164169 [Aaosphaeria arxii CBS 175.79]